MEPGVRRVERLLPWLMATAGYSLFLAVGFLFPFDLTADRSLAAARLEAFLTRPPFLALYLGNEFNAIKQALVRILLFVPLGAMWA